MSSNKSGAEAINVASCPDEVESAVRLLGAHIPRRTNCKNPFASRLSYRRTPAAPGFARAFC